MVNGLNLKMLCLIQKRIGVMVFQGNGFGWVTEYQVDGFQFHSLSSMMYTHNGFATFTDGGEKSLVHNVETFSQPGKLRNIIRSATGNRSPVGANKLKPSKLQLIRSSVKKIIRMTENHDSCSDFPFYLSEESHCKVSEVANGVVDVAECGIEKYYRHVHLIFTFH